MSDNPSRRSFFKTLGTAAAATAASQRVLSAAAPTLPPDGRLFPVTRNVFEMGGDRVGFLDSVKGGYPLAEVIREDVNGSGVVPKHLGTIRYKELEMTAGIGMEPKFYSLITSFLDRNPTAFDGAVSYSDAKLREGGRLEFFDALVTEVTFPALDAADRTVLPGVFGVKASIGRSTRVKGDASIQPAPDVLSKKKFLPSSFRISVDGLETAMSRVMKIERIVVRQEILGQEGETTILGPLQVPDVVVTASELHSEPLYDWFETMVEKGINDERNGRIEFLSPDLRTVLFTLKLFNLGIWWLATEDGDESVLRRVTAKMYCERMAFSIGA